MWAANGRRDFRVGGLGRSWTLRSQVLPMERSEASLVGNAQLWTVMGDTEGSWGILDLGLGPSTQYNRDPVRTSTKI